MCNKTQPNFWSILLKSDAHRVFFVTGKNVLSVVVFMKMTFLGENFLVL